MGETSLAPTFERNFTLQVLTPYHAPMKHDLQTLIGWKLDDARAWLQEHNANCALQIIETAPPAKPPRRENAQRKSAPRQSSTDDEGKLRERAGDWRVLRCRYRDENHAASTCTAIESTESIEIVTAREILRNE